MNQNAGKDFQLMRNNWVNAFSQWAGFLTQQGMHASMSDAKMQCVRRNYFDCHLKSLFLAPGHVASLKPQAQVYPIQIHT